MRDFLKKFADESNLIEGLAPATEAEVLALESFLCQDELTISTLSDYVSVIQPDAQLRVRDGLDVMVGKHRPPLGGVGISYFLGDILDTANSANLDGVGKDSAYIIHQNYEALHPFTDGNGRSGRALWLWLMDGDAALGFLHTWYYQSLNKWRKQ